MKYTCEIKVVLNMRSLVDFVKSVIDFLDFEPARMDVFYNEFKSAKDGLVFNKEYLIENLSKEELKGISSFSLYDKDYRSQKATPFFRFQISHSSDLENPELFLEWISYPEIAPKLILESTEMQALLSDASLVYCYYYNQGDVWRQTYLNNVDPSSWGRLESIFGFNFIAAPLMYFGKECEMAIPFERVKSFSMSELVQLNTSSIIKIQLFNLYEPPEDNRLVQKKFWKKMDLEKWIFNYRKRKIEENKGVYEKRLNRFKEIKGKK